MAALGGESLHRLGAEIAQGARDLSATAGLPGASREGVVIAAGALARGWLPRLTSLGRAEMGRQLLTAVGTIENVGVELQAEGAAAFIGARWMAAARVLQGMPADAHREVEEFLMRRRTLQGVMAPAPRAQRDFAHGREVAQRPRDLGAPRAPEDVQLDDMLQQRYGGVAAYRAQCWCCAYVGSVPPGVNPHVSARRCPQRAAAKRKMAQNPAQ